MDRIGSFLDASAEGAVLVVQEDANEKPEITDSEEDEAALVASNEGFECLRAQLQGAAPDEGASDTVERHCTCSSSLSPGTLLDSPALSYKNFLESLQLTSDCTCMLHR